VLLFNHADVKLREFLIRNPGPDGRRKPVTVQRAEMEQLRGMIAYVYARTCRRAFWLDYFGDQATSCSDAATACDNCQRNGVAAIPGDSDHLMVRKVLSCVARLDGRYGRMRIALCLVGSSTPEVLQAGLHRLSTYGVLRGRTQAYALDVLTALELGGLLAVEGGEYPKLRLTDDGRKVMLDRLRRPLALPQDDSPRVRLRRRGNDDR
jgi:ATP-dependent DNA helicase RecQ